LDDDAYKRTDEPESTQLIGQLMLRAAVKIYDAVSHEALSRRQRKSKRYMESAPNASHLETVEL
jgi:hypothetical protein